MSDILKELGQHLETHYKPTAQAESCETALLNGIKADTVKLGMQGVQLLIGHAEDWISCKFGSSPESSVAHADQLKAQLAINDVTKIAWECAQANFNLLFSNGLEAFLSAVGRCVVNKLIGGIIGGGGGGIFTEKPVGRCS